MEHLEADYKPRQNINKMVVLVIPLHLAAVGENGKRQNVQISLNIAPAQNKGVCGFTAAELKLDPTIQMESPAVINESAG